MALFDKLGLAILHVGCSYLAAKTMAKKGGSFKPWFIASLCIASPSNLIIALVVRVNRGRGNYNNSHDPFKRMRDYDEQVNIDNMRHQFEEANRLHQQAHQDHQHTHDSFNNMNNMNNM